jgi:hypothetical protein
MDIVPRPLEDYQQKHLPMVAGQGQVPLAGYRCRRLNRLYYV